MLALRAIRKCDRPVAIQVANDGFRAKVALGIDDEAPSAKYRRPDLIVSDLKMPGLSGYELLRAVRSIPSLASVPFVIFSSSNEPIDVERCLEAGADAYVQKPVGFEEYVSCVKGLVVWALDGFEEAPPPCWNVWNRDRGNGRAPSTAA